MTYRQRVFEFLKSNDFRNAVLFLIFSIVLTIIISSQNFFFQQIIENGVSKQNIPAPKNITVVDTIRTEQHKREVARRVEPILIQANDEIIRLNLSSLRNTIVKIRESNISDEKKFNQIAVLFDMPNSQLKTAQMEFLRDSDVETFNKLFTRAQNTLDTVLNIGITAQDFEQDKIKDVIKKSMYFSIPIGQSKMITTILSQIIVPNLIVDEIATNIAK
jgi:membrane-associated HD superfamily phosphohydrolase